MFAPTVILDNDDKMEHWKEIKPVLEKFAKTLNVKIHASNPHGCISEHPIAESGVMHIRFFCAPGQAAETRQEINNPFGISIAGSGQADAAQESGIGEALVDDRGTTVAEVLDNTLYVLFDLPHRGTQHSQLMTKIMNLYISYLSEGDEVRAARAIKRAEKQLERYKQLCAKRHKRRIEETRRNLASTQSNIDILSADLIEKSRKKQELAQDLINLESQGSETEETIIQEYQRLCNIPEVTQVVINNHEIQVFTEPIVITYRSENYNIGRFRIVLNHEYGRIRCFNLDQNLSNSKNHHPHVDSQGDPCLGNVSAGIYKLIAEYQYAIAAQMLIEFLKNVNDDGWYTHIDRWPKA